MSMQAFRKALHHRPLSQEERDELTPHELFVLVLARRLDRLTDAEQQRLEPADQRDLAAIGLIVSEAVTPSIASATQTPSAGKNLASKSHFRKTGL
jgi:hypothetical protein